jgi:DNA polymerase I
MEVAISQLEYSSTKDGTVIHVFGRDARGDIHRVDVTGFRPYFFATVESCNKVDMSGVDPDFKTEYRSIHGDRLYRLYTSKPYDVRDLRDRFDHFEADVLFTTRFMIDLNLTNGISVPDATVIDYHEISSAVVNAPTRISIVDIECEDERGFPEPDRDAIICITCFDSFTQNYTTFLLLADGNDTPIKKKIKTGGLKNGCFNTDMHTIFTFSSEPDLLKTFCDFMGSTDPDILTGWNFIDFDMPYILGRMDHFGIPRDCLARLPGYSSMQHIELRGRVLFDLLTAYKKMHQQQKPSYRLDAIAFDEVGEQKMRYTGTLSNLWRTDPAALVEYNFKDVELCVSIEKKNNIVEFFREIARYVGMPMDKTLNSSSVVDALILHRAHGKFVLPSKKVSADAEEFEGATVFPPKKGVHENVAVLDLTSLYPMIMLTLNASPETKSKGGELVAPNGVRFMKSPDGLVRSILMELFNERSAKKKLRNNYPYDSREYKMYDMQQSVLKVIMNTYYGVSGFKGFRLSDREIGSAVTSVGRAILQYTRSAVEEKGYEVIGGDTDAVNIKVPATTREETIKVVKGLEKFVNEKYKDFAKDTLNADVHYFSTKFEKLYARFFSGGRKKRYAGLLAWKEGKDVNEVDIVGFESKRSDTSQLAREVQKTTIEMILHGKTYEEIKTYLAGIITNYRKGEFPLDMIGIPGGFGKAFDNYQTDDAHLRGAKYANAHLHTNFERGSKPKRVYIKTVTAKYPKTDVVCFEYGDQVPKEFVVDTEVMLEKTIQKPVGRIIEALDWDWNDIDPQRTTLAQWGV